MMQWRQQKNLSTAVHLKNLPKIAKHNLQSLELWRLLAKQQRMSLMNYVRNIPLFLGNLAGIRDKLIHAYFGVNLKVVWLSVKEGIPEAKPDIKRILDEM